MTELDRALAEVFSELADEAPHDPGLAARVRQRARRRSVLAVAGVAVAASAVAVAGVLAARPWQEAAPAGPAAPVAMTPACDGRPRTAVLPDWARDGFTDPEPKVPFVRSRSGDVVAVLFGGQLWSPPRQDVSNKVLWVWRAVPGGATGDVTMTAQLAGTSRIVTTGLPLPEGPSTVDLPAAGCWRITLTSPRGTDTIDLDYAAP
jgi:hypothetical protein